MRRSQKLEQHVRQHLRQHMVREWQTPTAAVLPSAGLLSHGDASVVGNLSFRTGSGNGDPVDQVNDLSGNAAHWVKTGGSNEPLWVAGAQNGLGALDFVKANSQHLETPALRTGTQTGHLFAVMKTTGVAGEATGFGAFGSNGSGSYHTFSDEKLYHSFGSATRRASAGTIAAVHSWHLLDVWSESADWGIRINDTDQSMDSGTNTPDWFATTFYWGVNGFSQYGTFQLAEWAFFDAKQTGDDRTDAVNYFNNKWSLF